MDIDVGNVFLAIIAAALVMGTVEAEAKKRRAEAAEIVRKLDELLARAGPQP